MIPPLRIGLLGASRIAPKAVIGPARTVAEVEVTAVAARRLDKAQAYAAEHGIAHALEGYEALVEHPEVDVVYCALPPSAHLQPCLQAIAAGKPLLVEKPFSRNAREAATIAEAADKAGVMALEAFHYRFHSLFERALERVRAGAIGRILAAKGVFHAAIAQGPDELRWRPELGGGGTMDLGCYVLHALRTLVGEEPEVTDAQAQVEHGVDAVMRSRLHFPGGAVASVESSMRGERLDWIELEGDAGRLRVDNFVSPQRGGRLAIGTASGLETHEAEGPTSYEAQLLHLCDVLRRGAAPLTGGADAVATMTLIDRVRTAAGLESLL